MKRLLTLLVLLNLLVGAGWFAWTQIFGHKALPEVRVSTPVAQALPSPRQEQVTKHLENPRLAELTGYLEVIKAQKPGSKAKNDAIFFYTVHTAAGPIRFQPVIQIEERIHALHGSLVHLQESKNGYELLNRADDRRFSFELIASPKPISAVDPQVIRVLVTPNLNGVKTRKALLAAKAAKSPFDRIMIGPDCLAPTGTQIFALMDQALMAVPLIDSPVLLDFLVVAKDECLKAEYLSLGQMPYLTSEGLRSLQVRFRIWDGMIDSRIPESAFKEQIPAEGTESPLQIQNLQDGAGCGDIKISALLHPTRHPVRVDQKVVFRAHQVGDQLIHRCQTSTDLLGVASCTITGLNPSLPYLVSAQYNDHFDFQIWSTHSCVDPSRSVLSFVKRTGSHQNMSCEDHLPVVLRTENLPSGSQVIVMAEDQVGHQETCLATVNEADGIGLAKCNIPGVQEDSDYTLLAMYDNTRTWQFAQTQKKPKNCSGR